MMRSPMHLDAVPSHCTLMPPHAHGPHSPITEPPAEPDQAPGPVDPDSNEPDDSIESPEPPRQPGRPRPAARGRACR